jgi:OmpA-OmpF porin, OOP family
MKKLILSAFSLMSLYAVAQELPDNAQPGKCYIKCITADEFKEETETIEIAPAYKKLRTVPATFKIVTEEVLVKEASVRKVYVPAVYETVMVELVSDNKAVNYEVVPATFSKDAVTIETMPKVGKWEYTQLKDCPSANKEDCMVACFVESPSKSVTVPMTKLQEDASVREIPLSEGVTTYKKMVIKEPARMDEMPIPAEYAVIKRKVIDQPAKVMEESVPGQTRTVTKTTLAKKGGMTVWEEVDCNVASGVNLLPINYELNSALITGDSKSTIDQTLVSLMKSKPGLRIEIASHTDSRGDDNYNSSLSQQRAQSVVNYLVSRGISRNRLVARGFGETKLKNNCGNGSNCSEEEHSENRRTEFRILR